MAIMIGDYVSQCKVASQLQQVQNMAALRYNVPILRNRSYLAGVQAARMPRYAGEADLWNLLVALCTAQAFWLALVVCFFCGLAFCTFWRITA